ncbi:hypothetical protein E4U16_000854 [Claviceps sp. LM84 group G4]|nr:hypothetical protein E4U16_000854 [Claviceps sp. LM84 group G4]
MEGNGAANAARTGDEFVQFQPQDIDRWARNSVTGERVGPRTHLLSAYVPRYRDHSTTTSVTKHTTASNEPRTVHGDTSRMLGIRIAGCSAGDAVGDALKASDCVACEAAEE